MKLHVDPAACQAYGLCAEKAPGHIELDEWGYAAITESEVGDGESVREAVAICPNLALRLEKK